MPSPTPAQIPDKVPSKSQHWISREKAKGAPSDPSLLEGLFALLKKLGPLHISFEDLSGIARDVPFLQLSAWEQQHTCQYCQYAKRNVTGYQDCGANKYSVNRLVLRRMEGLYGQCHLGLTDIVEPVIFHQRVLGIFYFGSVILEGTEELARQRIEKYCRRRRFSSKPYLRQLALVPRITRDELEEYRGQLRLAARMTAALLESWGLPEERYHAEIIGPLWSSPEKQRNLPPIVLATIRHVQIHYREPLKTGEIARRLGFHPVHLSRVFRQHMQCALGDYIQRVRIDHARQRLKYSQLQIAEIGFEVGFEEKSHFGRVFKELVGQTPGEYRKLQQAAGAPRPSRAQV